MHFIFDVVCNINKFLFALVSLPYRCGLVPFGSILFIWEANIHKSIRLDQHGKSKHSEREEVAVENY